MARRKEKVSHLSLRRQTKKQRVAEGRELEGYEERRLGRLSEHLSRERVEGTVGVGAT